MPDWCGQSERHLFLTSIMIDLFSFIN